MKNWILAMSLAAAGTLSAETFVVNEGEEKALTDDIVGDYDGASVAKGGRLFLDLSAPQPFAITGTGEVVKRNDAAWTMTDASKSTGFKGDYVVAGGVIETAVTGMFGAINDPKLSLVVTNGATVSFKTTVDAVLWIRKVKIAGRGFNGRGAIEVDGVVKNGSDYFMHTIELLDDALFTIKKNAYFFLDGNVSNPAYIELNGHTLSFAGGGVLYCFNAPINGDGCVEVSGASDSGRTQFCIRGWDNARPNTAITDSTTAGFALSGYGEISLMNKSSNFNRPLVVRGPGNRLSHSEQYGINPDLTHAHRIWPGPIILETTQDGTSELTVSVNGAKCGLAMTGAVSGEGKLTFAGAGKHFAEFDTSAFSGTVEVNMDNDSASFVFGSPSVLSENTTFVRTKGRVLFGTDNWAWTLAEVNGFLGANPSVPASPLCFGSDWKFGWSANSVPGCADEKTPLNLLWTSGLGVLSGTSPYYAYRINVINADARDFTSALAIRDATVVVATNGCIGAGLDDANLYYGRLVISNALVCSENPFALDKYNTEHESYATPSNSLVVADNGRGILEVEAGAVITNRLLVGAHGNGAVWNNISFGGVRQRGGKFVAVDPNNTISKGNSIGVGQNAGGYYELLGGELETHGTFSIGCWGTGVMLIDGGTLTVTNLLGSETKGIFEVASANGGRGALRVTSGRVNYRGGDTVFIGRGNTSGVYSSLTVDGEDADCDFGSAQFNFGWGHASGTYFVNFNAGVFTAGKFYKHQNEGRNLTNKLYLNFNGGTFRAGGGGEVFGEVTDRISPDAIFVYEGGATIDTQGNTCTVRVPIEAPKGKGVKSIELANPITHVMSPIVEIRSATGVGASAFAHYDWETHTIDRIDVTSPGSGYEDATVTLRYYTTSSNATATVATNLVADAGTGSFTKKGSGILNLGATNTWGGATILAGGTLKCSCDCAIPQGTTVVLAGGVLNMNGKKMENGDPCPKKWAVDAERAKELGGTIPYAGAITFLEGSTLEVRNAAEMDEDGEKLVLLETTGGISGRPAVIGTVDPKWHLRFSAKKVVLAPNRGTVLIVR